MDKFLIQLASRLQDSAFREEVLECLEDERKELIRLAETPFGQRVQEGMKSGKISSTTRAYVDNIESDDSDTEDPAATEGIYTDPLDAAADLSDGDLDEDDETVEVVNHPKKRKAQPPKNSDKFEQDEEYDELIERFRLDTSKPFVDADLEKDDVIQKGLQMVYKKRLGAEGTTYRQSIHIHYSRLSSEVQVQMKQRMKQVPKDTKDRLNNRGYVD